MIQLRTDNIIFNGLSCKAYNLTPCSVGNTDVTITTGLSRNITYEEGVNGIKNITKIQDGYNEVTIGFCRIVDGKPLDFDYTILKAINDWLITDTFKPLEFNGYKANAIYKKSTLTNSTKILNVTFDLEPYLTQSKRNKYHIKNSEIINISNNSNIKNRIPIKEIKVNITKGNYFKITNLTNNSKFYIENLNDNEKNFIIDGELQCIDVVDDDTINLFPKITNRDWNTIKMIKGRNKLKLEVTEGVVTVIFEDKLGMM